MSKTILNTTYTKRNKICILQSHILKNLFKKLNTHHPRRNAHRHQLLEEEFAGVGHSNQRYLGRDFKRVVID